MDETRIDGQDELQAVTTERAADLSPEAVDGDAVASVQEPEDVQPIVEEPEKAPETPAAPVAPPAAPTTKQAAPQQQATPPKAPTFTYVLPGIIMICIGVAALGIEVPDETIRFGADFYTETYQGIAAVARIAKNGFGMLIMALGVDSLFKGMAEVSKTNALIAEMEALRQTLTAGPSRRE